MMKDVLIKIKGVQGIDDDTDTIEYTTTGRYGIKDGSLYLSYPESEAMADKPINTVLYVKDNDTVILKRSGGMQSRLVVERDRRNNCYYSTPHGELLIGIFGEEIENSLTENGGRLSLCYTIDSNLQLISRNRVEILVSPLEN